MKGKESIQPCSCCNGTDASLRRLPRRKRRRAPAPSIAITTAGAFLLALHSPHLPHATTTAAAEPTTHQQQQPQHNRHLLPSTATSKIGTPRSTSSICNPTTQHTILFTLYTDAHSITDNSWTLSHAPFGIGLETGNSGTYIDSESMTSGGVGYGAVVTHTMCADKSTNLEALQTFSGPDSYIGSSSLVESCYDLELTDVMGDGLTAPHSAQGGLAGGFSIQVDNVPVAEHRGMACLSEDESEWNECALEGGFEYCGVRVCVTNDTTGGVGGTASSAATTKATISGLTSSQCQLSQPQCSPNSPLTATSQSSLTVNVDTDSWGDELSWEARRSSKGDSKKMNMALMNELILAGGPPVFGAETSPTTITGSEPPLLGQVGVGISPLGDNESYESVACIPKDMEPAETCFDLRVYDAYGDGIGCGASGSVSFTIENDDGLAVGLTQRDEDMAKRQTVNGESRKACVGKEALSKWSYCAVRLCGDGTVLGLEGNQCEFGQGLALIDARYEGSVDPLEGLVMKSPSSPVDNTNDDSAGRDKVELDDEEWKELKPLIGLTPYLEPMSEAEGGDDTAEEEQQKLHDSWADYYQDLQPGFRDQISPLFGGDGVDPDKKEMFAASYENLVANSNSIEIVGESEGPGKYHNKPGDGKEQTGSGKQMQQQYQAFKGPRPELQVASAAKPDVVDQDNEPRGPKADMAQSVSNQAGGMSVQEGLQLKPFEIALLSTQYPAPLKYRNEGELSDATADFLVAFFADKSNELGRGSSLPSDFALDCTKSRRKIASELRWIVECTGLALFQDAPSGSLPRKKVLNDVLQDAFVGKSEKEFFRAMYDKSPQDNGNNNKKQMQQLSSSGTIDISKVMNGLKKEDSDKKRDRDKKRQSKLDRIRAKIQQGRKDQQSQKDKDSGRKDGPQGQGRRGRNDNDGDGRRRMLRSSIR